MLHFNAFLEGISHDLFPIFDCIDFVTFNLFQMLLIVYKNTKHEDNSCLDVY